MICAQDLSQKLTFLRLIFLLDVAVAGLPTPRKDHAVVMVRFANNCLRKVHELLASLQETFGPDTGNLGFRVGLHSGTVTAGVLRGQKARFQLFGGKQDAFLCF